MQNKDEQYRNYAGQLRHPNGDLGKVVAEKMNKGNRLMNLDAIKQLHVADNDQILEIGMSNGFFVNEIVAISDTVRYFGCDTSTEMVDQANSINERWVEKKQAFFTKGDARHLPFEDSYFNKIFTINTIYFWDDVLTVLGEISRTLKKNGLLVIAFRPESVMQQMPVTKYGFTLFTQETVTRLLTDHGFSITNIIEKKDEDVILDELVIKNAYIIVCARKV